MFCYGWLHSCSPMLISVREYPVMMIAKYINDSNRLQVKHLLWRFRSIRLHIVHSCSTKRFQTDNANKKWLVFHFELKITIGRKCSVNLWRHSGMTSHFDDITYFDDHLEKYKNKQMYKTIDDELFAIDTTCTYIPHIWRLFELQQCKTAILLDIKIGHIVSIFYFAQ